jgi:hypothetical protein
MTTMTSRVEIADHVEEAFRHGPATREDLLGEAVRTGARPAVIDVLGRLPERPYPTLRELWADLPGLPVER